MFLKNKSFLRRPRIGRKNCIFILLVKKLRKVLGTLKQMYILYSPCLLLTLRNIVSLRLPRSFADLNPFLWTERASSRGFSRCFDRRPDSATSTTGGRPGGVRRGHPGHATPSVYLLSQKQEHGTPNVYLLSQ